METFELDGGSLEFSVRGDGPALLLVHGSVFADPWEPMLSYGDLLADYQVVTYHRRGYGGSAALLPLARLPLASSPAQSTISTVASLPKKEASLVASITVS